MSFDLYTYIDEPNTEKLALWQQCLKSAGIVCDIPVAFDFSDKLSKLSISCKLYPPLAQPGSYVENCEFLIEPMPIDKKRINELIENTDDKILINRLKEAKYDVVINTDEENQEVAMKIICFVSATLANAFNGVLFDPQEFGPVYGPKVYEVARYYCSFPKSHSSIQQESLHKTKSLTLNISIVFLIIIIVLLIYIGDLSDYLYKLF